MNAIISKEPMGASSVGEWVKLGERQLSASQDTYNTFCDFTDIYEAISVIHVTYMLGRAYSGLLCTTNSGIQQTVSEETWRYYYAYLSEAVSITDNLYFTKHFWRQQFYNGSNTSEPNPSYWSPVPNEGFTTSSTNLWSSVYPDALYQKSSFNSMGIDGTQTIYGLKIS